MLERRSGRLVLSFITLSIVAGLAAVIGYFPKQVGASDAEAEGIDVGGKAAPQDPLKRPVAGSERSPGGTTVTLIVDRTDDNGASSACTAAANDCSLRGAITNAGVE
jgi:hypothetical protein